jgi:pyrimidine operon attenuation protein/uracil phosphoribosyltransferase
MKEKEIRQAITEMAVTLIESNEGAEDLILMGIHRRGVQVAHLLKKEIEATQGIEVPLGTLDITFYRDDFFTIGPKPIVGQTKLPEVSIEGKKLVIVDDVIFTGRTARAGLNELMDWGRPAKISLCVLIDRGGREVPIQADTVGRQVEVPTGYTVAVMVPELDGRWAVELASLKEGTS